MKKQVSNIRYQVEESVKKGAKIVYGDLDFKIPDPELVNGHYFHPLILENITRDQPAFHEELFGPVFSLFRFSDDMEAIELANATEYGLSGSIFTKDMERAKRKALKLECGNVFINEIVASDPAIPCGGVKESGYGRECFKDGLHETLNRKAIIFGEGKWMNYKY